MLYYISGYLTSPHLFSITNQSLVKNFTDATFDYVVSVSLGAADDISVDMLLKSYSDAVQQGDPNVVNGLYFDGYPIMKGMLDRLALMRYTTKYSRRQQRPSYRRSRQVATVLWVFSICYCQPNQHCLYQHRQSQLTIDCHSRWAMASDILFMPKTFTSDLNECSLGRVCGFASLCVNTMGSYYCDCRKGFVKNTTGLCDDVNECLQSSSCRRDQDCFNAVGEGMWCSLDIEDYAPERNEYF